MEMQVLHGLTGVLAAVRHDTEAVGKAELLRELRNDGEDVTDERGLLIASAAELGEAMWAFGITRKCCGASGWMS